MLPIQDSVSLPSSYFFKKTKNKTKDTVLCALIVYNLISTHLRNIYLFSAYYVPATLPEAWTTPVNRKKKDPYYYHKLHLGREKQITNNK